MPLNRQSFMNTYIDDVTLEEALHYVENCIIQRRNSHVITPNVDQIVRIENDLYFREICNSCDLLLVDGHPLLWIAKLYGKPFKQKICGSDLIFDLCELSEKKGYSIFLLGAAPGVADKAVKKLIYQYPKLKIVGAYSPPIGFEKDLDEINKINEILIKSNADLLFVGMGVPKQDIFIYENKNKYQIPVSFSIGGAIDFVAGEQRRAPQWVRNVGFEWLYRLVRNPRRLFKRYLIDDIAIIGLIWKYRKR